MSPQWERIWAAMPFSSSGGAKASMLPPSSGAPTGPPPSISSFARAMAMSSCSIAPAPPQHLPKAAVAGARIFYASGISQAISDSAAAAVALAIDIARQANLAVAYDTNYRARLWPPARAREVIHEAVRRARYVFVSEEDGEALTEIRHPDALIDFYLGLRP